MYQDFLVTKNYAQFGFLSSAVPIETSTDEEGSQTGLVGRQQYENRLIWNIGKKKAGGPFKSYVHQEGYRSQMPLGGIRTDLYVRMFLKVKLKVLGDSVLNFPVSSKGSDPGTSGYKLCPQG